MSEYPKRTESGGLIWACCVSAIGPACRHRIAPDGSVMEAGQ